jgi:UTP--glucose-1-phosphate uridylyltransferase
MSVSVKKAVIPAAGLGTRVLPASKSMPKEMLPIVDKPAIQYIVEEAVASGICDILIIISRGKGSVEDHFDRSPELEKRLLDSGKEDVYNQMVAISEMANIHFLRQQEPKGLGHAVLCAKAFVGNEPFAVLYGDDVIISDYPVCKQLCDVYEEYGKDVVGIKEVSWEQIKKYSSLLVNKIEKENNIYSVSNMVEKPQTREETFSLFSILGRCVLSPSIFRILEKIPKGAGGELQLTDAMAVISRETGMYGVDFIGKRYDMGSKLGILQACVEIGLRHEEIGRDFSEYLKSMTALL